MLHYDTDTGRVSKESETRPTHTPEGAPIETPPDVILVSRAWYDSIREEVQGLRETLHRLTRLESD